MYKVVVETLEHVAVIATLHERSLYHLNDEGKCQWDRVNNVESTVFVSWINKFTQ